MPSTRELRRHIRSIKSTRQITRAMEMVAASKLRKATEAALGGKPYAERISKMISDTMRQGEAQHPLLDKRPIKKTVLLVISSDKGLAGSYNANILKAAMSFIKASDHEVAVVTLGKKAERALHRLGHSAIQSFVLPTSKPTLSDVLPIAGSLAQLYATEECDRVVVLATRFKTMFTQEPEIRELLPLALTPSETAQPFLFEPSTEEMLDVLIPRYLAMIIFQDLQEAQAAEHAARRMAMHSATDNASDLMDALQLTYNSVRQNSITREIAEITSGAAALQTT